MIGSNCSIAQVFVLKYLFHIFPIYFPPPPPLKGLLKFIAVFAWHESYRGALIQYTSFMKIYILYYPLTMAGLLVKLIHFPYATWREKAMNCYMAIYLAILPYFASVFHQPHLCNGKEICDEFHNYLSALNIFFSTQN